MKDRLIQFCNERGIKAIETSLDSEPKDTMYYKAAWNTVFYTSVLSDKTIIAFMDYIKAGATV